MLSVVSILVTPFMQNARLMFDDERQLCTVVDPGGQSDLILQAIEKLGLTCDQILLTHAHIDHAGGVQSLRAEAGVPMKLFAHPDDRPLRESISRQAAMFGLLPSEYQNCPEPDVYLNDGDAFTIDGHAGEILFTPGHAPGHISWFYDGPCKCASWEPRSGRLTPWESVSGPVVHAGDALFQGSIGRTDLPLGDHDTLLASIKQKLMTLPDQTRVFCGHGPDTTVGAERLDNPFLR